MQKQLYLYIAIILAFVGYNQFLQVQDEKLNSIINILFASFLFLYIAYIAFTVLKKMRDSRKK